MIGEDGLFRIAGWLEQAAQGRPPFPEDGPVDGPGGYVGLA